MSGYLAVSLICSWWVSTKTGLTGQGLEAQERGSSMVGSLADEVVLMGHQSMTCSAF